MFVVCQYIIICDSILHAEVFSSFWQWVHFSTKSLEYCVPFLLFFVPFSIFKFSTDTHAPCDDDEQLNKMNLKEMLSIPLYSSSSIPSVLFSSRKSLFFIIIFFFCLFVCLPFTKCIASNQMWLCVHFESSWFSCISFSICFISLENVNFLLYYKTPKGYSSIHALKILLESLSLLWPAMNLRLCLFSLWKKSCFFFLLLFFCLRLHNVYVIMLPIGCRSAVCFTLSLYKLHSYFALWKERKKSYWFLGWFLLLTKFSVLIADCRKASKYPTFAFGISF